MDRKSWKALAESVIEVMLDKPLNENDDMDESFDLDEGVNHYDWKAHHDQMHQKHISAGDHESADLHADAKDAHSKAINTGSKSDSKKALELSRKARNNDKKMGSYSRTGAGLGPAGARVG